MPTGINSAQKRKYVDRLWIGQGGNCAYCGRQMVRGNGKNHPHKATLEHILPKAFGGRFNWKNIVLVHFMCNHERGCGPSRPFVIDLSAIGGREPWRGHD